MYSKTKKSGSARPRNSRQRYADDISKAYRTGYRKGWEEAHQIPDRLGATAAATYGYNRGITHRKNSDKYSSNYNKSKGNY